LLKRLKKLLRLMGELNDLTIARTLFSRVGAEPAVEKALLAQCEQRLTDLPQLWKRFCQTEQFWEKGGKTL